MSKGTIPLNIDAHTHTHTRARTHTSDTATMQMFMLYIHDLWSIAVLVPFATVMLYYELSWVAFICVLLMVLSVPLQVSPSGVGMCEGW